MKDITLSYLCCSCQTQPRPSPLLPLWLYIEKYPPADYSHLHFAYCEALLSGCLSRALPGTPLGIQRPVTVKQAYGFQPYPCSPVTDMHVYKLQDPRHIHRGPPQSPPSPRLHLMTSSLIAKIFFSIIRQALASFVTGIGWTLRRWFMQKVLGESRGSRVAWLSFSVRLGVGRACWTKNPDQCFYKWEAKP